MKLKDNNLSIRYATTADAKILCEWWNDGRIMAHAGFPNGTNTNVEEIEQKILGETDDTMRRFIIEIDGVPAGEMNYKNKGNNVSEIGIKICDFNQHGKGYGSRLLKIFVNYLFTGLNFDKITLDTNKSNHRAQHVYEKLGFQMIKTEDDVCFYELVRGVRK